MSCGFLLKLKSSKVLIFYQIFIVIIMLLSSCFEECKIYGTSLFFAFRIICIVCREDKFSPMCIKPKDRGGQTFTGSSHCYFIGGHTIRHISDISCHFENILLCGWSIPTHLSGLFHEGNLCIRHFVFTMQPRRFFV